MIGYLFKLLVCIHRVLLNILQGSTVGVRVIVVSPNKEILLVRHTYCPGWYLPGGGVKKQEHPADAAIREIREEAGIISSVEPSLFGVYFQKYKGVDDYPLVYIVKDYSIGTNSSLEIAETQWVKFDNLPVNINRGCKNRILEHFEKRPKSKRW